MARICGPTKHVAHGVPNSATWSCCVPSLQKPPEEVARSALGQAREMPQPSQRHCELCLTF